MKEFGFDQFKNAFKRELKSAFDLFLCRYKDKGPYIFTLIVPDYIAINHPKSYAVSFNGNTVEEYEASGYAIDTSEADGLYFKYCSDEWADHSHSENDFPECNRIILDYIIENEHEISDEVALYRDAFIQFRLRFFNNLLQYLEEMKLEGQFELAGQDPILLNFEVRGFFQENGMITNFERLNSKDEALLFSRWL